MTRRPMTKRKVPKKAPPPKARATSAGSRKTKWITVSPRSYSSDETMFALGHLSGLPGAVPREKEFMAAAAVVAPAPPHGAEDDFGPPARAIGLLRSDSPDGSLPVYGTAWIVGPRTLVTAGHNVYRDFANALSVRVALGYDGDESTAVWRNCCQWHFPRVWADNPNPNNPFDLAVLEMEEDMPIASTGRFDFSDLPDAQFDKSTVNVLGYPGVESHDFRMRWTSGLVIGRPGAISIDYGGLTGAGMSGGPVFMKLNGRRIAVGLHRSIMTDSFGGTRYCMATRINQEVQGIIQGYVSTPTCPP